MNLYPRVSLCALVLLCACSDDQLSPTELSPIRPRMIEYTASASPAILLTSYLNSTNSWGSSVNDLGAIAGSSATRATVWMTGVDSVPTSTVPVVLATAANAAAINAGGQIAGQSFNSSIGRYEAMLWTPVAGGGYTSTSVGLPGAVFSIAGGINEQGQVVGWSRFIINGSLVHRCFLWTPTAVNGTSGNVQEVPGLGGNHCQAEDINSAGQIVGASTTATSPSPQAFVHSGGMTIQLDPTALTSFAAAINNAGQISGSRLPFSALERPVVWNPVGGAWSANDIVVPASGSVQFAMAHDINDAGFVVGELADSESTKAFFWNAGTSLQLTAPGSTGIWALGLSNVVGNRVIVAGGSSEPTGSYSVRWTISLAPVVTEECGEQATRIISEFATAGYLTDGGSRSLTAKLEGAARQAAQGKTTAAANLLKALANEIAALQESGRITADQATQLTTPVACLIDSL